MAVHSHNNRPGHRHTKGGGKGVQHTTLPPQKRKAPSAGSTNAKKRKQEKVSSTQRGFDYDLIIIGAGASGIGCGIMAQRFGIDSAKTLIVERGAAVGSTFNQWPAEMRFITPSFNQQAFGFMDLNSVAYDTSPAQMMHVQHPTGKDYAEYLRKVAEDNRLPVVCHTNVTAVSPLQQDSEEAVEGFELSLTQSGFAAPKLPRQIWVKFIIWAAGEFQYPKTDGFPGASRHCVHNSCIKSWAELAKRSKERVVIGGFESGIDATVNLAAAGCNVTVLASTPYWEMRTLDPSTELAPYTAGRLRDATGGPQPPTLMSRCKVMSVEKETSGSGYVVTAEQSKPPAPCHDHEANSENEDNNNGSDSDSSESDSSDSKSVNGDNDENGENGEGPPEDLDGHLEVDKQGRIKTQLAAKSYRYRSFLRIFSKDTTPLLLEDCRSASAPKSAGKYTFWIGAGDKPRCTLEQMALDIFHFHTTEGSFDAARSGAEWWPLGAEAQGEWSWHKDTVLEQSGPSISPHLSTVTYLADEGPPTLIVEKKCPTDCSADISGQAQGGLLSRPQCGKHIVFDGRYLQAAPSELSLWDIDGTKQHVRQKGIRRSNQTAFTRLMVSIWLNWEPLDVVRCSETLATKMSNQPVPLDFGDEQKILKVPTEMVNPNQNASTDNSATKLDTIKWHLEAKGAQQTAMMTFNVQLGLIRQSGTKVGSSLLLRSPVPPGEPPEIVQVRTAHKPILATGFHSGIAKTVNHLFEWTEESLCQTGHGAGTANGAWWHIGVNINSSNGHGQKIPIGDPILTKCDESTLFPGLFLSGPQVRQDDQILCFVYKYRQRFAVVINEIATRLGLQTDKVVAECRKQHMFLDDLSCCKATCGSCGEEDGCGCDHEVESTCPLVRVEAKPWSMKRKREEAPAILTLKKV